MNIQPYIGWAVVAAAVLLFAWQQRGVVMSWLSSQSWLSSRKPAKRTWQNRVATYWKFQVDLQKKCGGNTAIEFIAFCHEHEVLENFMHYAQEELDEG